MNPGRFPPRIVAHWSRLTPFQQRMRRELPPHFAHLQAVGGEVDRAMAEIEERFLRIGTTLENITTTGSDLVKQCASLVFLTIGHGGGEIMIERAAQHIWRAVEFVEKNDGNMEQLIHQLSASSARICETLAAEQTLLRTLAPLNFVKTLFRVESASLPVDVQEMFYALAREIDRIRLRVEGGFKEKFQLIREIKRILDKAIIQLQAQQAQAKNSVSGLRQRMTTSLATMKASHEKNRNRDTRLSGVSATVEHETGRVVMSLQFQDIIAQKLQHVHNVLAEMDQSFAGLPADRTAACRTLHFIGQSGRIAGAQLTALQQELAGAGATIGDGLQKIIRQLETLDTDCLALRDVDPVTTGVDGAVQLLLDSLADVQRLMGETERHAMESHRTIKPIGSMTTNFTGFMRELSLEIQLIGLNAEIQAAHVGQGTGLEVLSAHTSAISRETSILSETLARDLDTLTSGLEQVVSGFKDIREENEHFTTELNSEFAKDNTGLHDYRNNTLQLLLQISELLPRLDQQIKAAIDQANFSSVVTAPLDELRAAVTALATTAETVALQSGIKVETTGLTDHHLGHYTMRSEVDIHQHALAGKATTAAVPVETAPPGDTEIFADDMLFETSASPSLQPPSGKNAPSSGPATMNENIDLWEDNPPPPPGNGTRAAA